MFFKLILENENGDRIDMTTTANQYMTSKIEGLKELSAAFSGERQANYSRNPAPESSSHEKVEN